MSLINFTISSILLSTTQKQQTKAMLFKKNILFYTLTILCLGLVHCKKNNEPEPQAGILSSSAGIVGDTLTITGSNLDLDKTKDSVKFGNLPAMIVSSSPAELKVVIPAGSGATRIQIKKGGSVTMLPSDFTINNLYIFGATDYIGNNGVGKVWKNGVSESLYDSEGREMTDMVIVGKDIYVCGNDYNRAIQRYLPVYWKNGVKYPLEANAGLGYTAMSIASSGSDVYIVGRQQNSNSLPFMAVWKNGKLVKSPVESAGSLATAVTVVGSDVYITGYDQGEKVWKYWKNGSGIRLMDEPNGPNLNSQTTDIFVQGKDVYVCGQERRKPVYWKNGEKTDLTPQSEINNVSYLGVLNAIVASGNDVYVAGYETSPVQRYGSTAKYWKNGEGVTLGSTARDDYSNASDISIFGNDVYVIGDKSFTEEDRYRGAVYWKNGRRTNLTGLLFATSMTIAP
jgi:hypothetical protein